MKTIFGKSRIPNFPESLSHLQAELIAWLSTGSFGQRIPEELWKAAAELTRVAHAVRSRRDRVIHWIMDSSVCCWVLGGDGSLLYCS